jgi:hypothetical protein
MKTYIVEIKTMNDGYESYVKNMITAENQSAAIDGALKLQCYDTSTEIVDDEAQDMSGDIIHSLSGIKEVQPEHPRAIP